MTDTTTDPYTPTRAVMTREELASHHLTAFGRDYSQSDDGYGDMKVNRRKGWRSISCWGRDGWDLANWPYVVISHGERDGKYRLLSVCEGDHDVYVFDTAEDREAGTDYLFIWYGVGRGYGYWIAQGLTEDSREELDVGTLTIPVEFRGPYRRG